MWSRREASARLASGGLEGVPPQRPMIRVPGLERWRRSRRLAQSSSASWNLESTIRFKKAPGEEREGGVAGRLADNCCAGFEQVLGVIGRHHNRVQGVHFIIHGRIRGDWPF